MSPPPETAPPVPTRVAIARFIVRSLCDDKGQPDTVLVVMYPWLTFAAYFFWEALNAPAAIIDANVSSEAVAAVLMVTLALILWAAALKLGAGVFVPLASAIGGAFKSVAGATRGVLAQARDYSGGPDRRLGVTDPGGELHREDPEAPLAPVTEEGRMDLENGVTDIDPPPMGIDPASDRDG
jgi:hypothetical protein